MKTQATAITVFVLLCLVVLVVHFAFTFVYSLPAEATPVAMRSKSERYTVPLFFQNWQLFAPDVPEYNVELEYRAYERNHWSNWLDASAASGYGKKSRIEYVEQSICTGLAWQVVNNFYAKDQRAQFDLMMQSSDYRRAAWFAAELYHQNNGSEIPDSMQLRLNFRFNPKPGAAFNYQYSQLEFPAFER